MVYFPHVLENNNQVFGIIPRKTPSGIGGTGYTLDTDTALRAWFAWMYHERTPLLSREHGLYKFSQPCPYHARPSVQNTKSTKAEDRWNTPVDTARPPYPILPLLCRPLARLPPPIYPRAHRRSRLCWRKLDRGR